MCVHFVRCWSGLLVPGCGDENVFPEIVTDLQCQEDNNSNSKNSNVFLGYCEAWPHHQMMQVGEQSLTK